MSDKKVISIRFALDNKEDMELYKRLELEAGTSASLASVVKVKLKELYHREEKWNKDIVLQDRLVDVVREEMQESGMKIVGAILSGMGANHGTNASNLTVVPISVGEKDNLPEKSEELPLGALDFLD